MLYEQLDKAKFLKALPYLLKGTRSTIFGVPNTTNTFGMEIENEYTKVSYIYVDGSGREDLTLFLYFNTIQLIDNSIDWESMRSDQEIKSETEQPDTKVSTEIKTLPEVETVTSETPPSVEPAMETAEPVVVAEESPVETVETVEPEVTEAVEEPEIEAAAEQVEEPEVTEPEIAETAVEEPDVKAEEKPEPKKSKRKTTAELNEDYIKTITPYRGVDILTTAARITESLVANGARAAVWENSTETLAEVTAETVINEEVKNIENNIESGYSIENGRVIYDKEFPRAEDGRYLCSACGEPTDNEEVYTALCYGANQPYHAKCMHDILENLAVDSSVKPV